MLRDDLNAILAFIGTESLTDEEFETAEGEIEDEDNAEEVHTALTNVLDTRELVSTMHDRLNYYFLAQGVSVGSVDTAHSNIFVGSELSDDES